MLFYHCNYQPLQAHNVYISHKIFVEFQLILIFKTYAEKVA